MNRMRRLSALGFLAVVLCRSAPAEETVSPPPVKPEELGRWAQRWGDYHAIMWFWKGPAKGPKAFETLRKIGVTGSNVMFMNSHDAEAAGGFKFYVGDISEKGILHLRKNTVGPAVNRFRRNRTNRDLLVRPNCFNDPQVRRRLLDNVRKAVSLHKPGEPLAYSLGDEISIGSFASPVDWCYCPHCMRKMRKFLQEKYGSLEALNKVWKTSFKTWDAVVPETAEQQFRRNYWLFELFLKLQDKKPRIWPVLDIRYPDINLAQWNDHREFMDWSFAEILKELVDAAHEIDPDAPVGAVGLQAPSAWGGFDYARLTKALDWMEAYDIGEVREINRSFCPRDFPIVETHFIRTEADRLLSNISEAWYYLAHGDRGVIIWAMGRAVEDDYTLTPGGEALGRAYNAFHKGDLARHLLAAKPYFDPIAIYYSQPSIRFNWFVDAAVNYDTWPNRSGSIDGSGYSSEVWARRAFIDMLEDSGFQPRFVSYLDVMEKGSIPEDVAVLILPKTTALSDKEAEAIRRFVSEGGLLIADQQTGMLDEHLTGREQSVLSDVFGIRRKNSLLVEWYDAMKQHKDWDYGFREPEGVGKYLGFHVAEPGMTADGAEPEAEVNGVPVVLRNRYGQGEAVYLNVCVENYNFKRASAPRTAAALRSLLAKMLAEHGVEPACKVFAGDAEDISVERLWYRRGDWWYLCLVKNASFRKSIYGTSVSGVGDKPYRVRIQVPEADRIFDMRKGEELPPGNVIEDTFVPFEGLVYALRLKRPLPSFRRTGRAAAGASYAAGTASGNRMEAAAPAPPPPTPEELNEWGIKQVKAARRLAAAGLVWRASDLLEKVKNRVPKDQPAYNKAEELLNELDF